MGASPLAPDWLSFPADSNELLPKMWAQDVQRNPDGVLQVAGLGVQELAQQFGTPLYVVSEDDFRARARSFKEAFDGAFAGLCGGADVYYAGKSFLCTEVARWIYAEGLRLDTCSGGELAVAAHAGIPGKSLGLHGNNKSDAELNRALDMGVGRIIVDSIDELDRLSSLAEARGDVANVLLRLTPGVHAHTHDFIATAHEDQKFGLSMASDDGVAPAARAAAKALSHAHVNLLGVHCHIGSQIFEPDGFEVAARRLLEFLAEVKAEHGVELPELDLGGGYGIAYTEADHPRPPADIATAMAAVVGQTCAELMLSVPRISIEPGRAIAGPSTFTLYEVGTCKSVNVDTTAGTGIVAKAKDALNITQVTAARRYVSVDGGMSDNARPVLYDADYSATVASRSSTAEPVLSRVVGKHCESGDIVVRDVYLPADVAAGDLLAVPGTGAYCWALSSNYNYLARPPVVAVSNGSASNGSASNGSASSGSARVIIRGETEEDLLARDVGIPR